jgi:arylsulfatase A-like enzyme
MSWRAGRCTLIVMVAALLACEAEQPRTPPRLVVLFAPCTLSKAVLSPYAASLPFTPNLERFAKRAITFERHQTEAGSSGLAYASILTGTHADRHHVFRHPSRLAEALYLIFEVFDDHGYQTFFWNQQRAASIGLRYGQGVDRPNAISAPLDGDSSRFKRILRMLEKDPSYKAFVFANLSTTHGPYRDTYLEELVAEHPELLEGVSPKSFKRLQKIYRRNPLALSYNFDATVARHGLEDELSELEAVVGTLYRSNVRHLDRQFGVVLDAIEASGLDGESLILFTADHGEVFQRESASYQWTHSGLVASEVVGVPLLVSLPDGVGAGTRYTEVTRSIDLLPTIAGLAGLALPDDLDIEGVDLTPAMLGKDEAPQLLAFSHTSLLPASVYDDMRKPGGKRTWGERLRFEPEPDIDLMWVAVRSGDWLFKHRKLDDTRWAHQAFDLRSDPSESHDRFDPSDALHAEMAAELDAYRARLVASYWKTLDDQRARELPSQQAERELRALGYIR